MSSQLVNRGDMGNLFSIGVKREVLRHLPDKHLSVFRGRGDDTVVERVPASENERDTLGSQEVVGSTTYQSVSRTVAVCPRNSGIWSGSLPRSFRGMTANAPPPEESQLTERYSGLTYCKQKKHGLVLALLNLVGAGNRLIKVERTLTRLVSQALRLMWMLS